MQITRRVINHSVGLHARPAAQFVQAASKYESEVTVANITNESEAVNAKSILLVLTLGIQQGHEIEIIADGADEHELIQDLKDLIENNFGEEAANAAP